MTTTRRSILAGSFLLVLAVGAAPGPAAHSSVPAAAGDVTSKTLLTAYVPAHCKLPAQRLVNGMTTKGSPGKGRILTAKGLVGYADFTGAGSKQALAVYSCHSGGAEWAQALVLVGTGGKLVGHYKLGHIDGYARATVTSVTASGKTATVRWFSSDSKGRQRIDHTTRVQWTKGALKLTALPPKVFPLTTSRFGPVHLPNQHVPALRELRLVLGTPTRLIDGPGCFLAEDPLLGFYLARWGDLTIYGENRASQYDGWSVTGKKIPKNVTLPYGIGVGTTFATLKARVSGYTVNDGGVFTEGYIIWKGKLSWWLDATNTRVTAVYNNVHFCE